MNNQKPYLWLMRSCQQTKTYNDYFPFGMEMPDRQASSSDYRYGFNGMERDNEVSGQGNSYDFGARIYNSRLGRFLSIDPLTKDYPWQSPYAFVRNNPIFFEDINGEGDPLEVMKIRDNRASNLQGKVRNQGQRVHQGFDLYAPPGTSILAVKVK